MHVYGVRLLLLKYLKCHCLTQSDENILLWFVLLTLFTCEATKRMSDNVRDI